MESHRLTAYIARNPPDADDKTETAPDTKTKGKTKGKKGAKNAGGNQDSDEGSPTEQNGKTVPPHFFMFYIHFLFRFLEWSSEKQCCW